MPYPSGHREQVRNRIVESARRLFNRSGFETVSVDSIMANAGLTRGAFYSYFESKSDLYAEVLGCFFTDPNWRSRWEGVDVDLASPNAGPQIVRAYLSRQHFDDVENSCPMVALPSDVARSDERVKGAFETVFKAMVTVLGREVEEHHSGVRKHRDGHRGSLYRWYGCGEVAKRRRLQRSRSRCRDTRRARSGRLELRRR